MTHISHNEVETLNWLSVTERFNQCINSVVFKYVNDQYPNYVNEVFQIALENNIQTWASFQKLKYPYANLTQVKWRSLTFLERWRAKPLTCFSQQKVWACLNII